MMEPRQKTPSLQMGEYEAFLRDYCHKCGKGCERVDEKALRRLDDGRLACKRYVCSILWEWR